MSECANCYKSVYVPDGYEFEEGDMCMSCTKQELDSSWELVDRLGKLLHDTANVLHGGPMENGLWSYHDIPELTAKLKESLERKEYYDAMRSREIDMAQIPESQKRFVSALLNQRDDSYRKMEESKQENDKLRGILAKSDLDCVYCGLPKKDMGRCYFGFPGCGRADDLMLEANDGTKPEPSL